MRTPVLDTGVLLADGFTFLSPNAFEDVGIIGLTLFIVVMFVWATATGRIVFGWQHKAIVNEHIRAREAADARSIEDQNAIAKFANAAMQANASAEMQTYMMTTLREIVAESRPVDTEPKHPSVGSS